MNAARIRRLQRRSRERGAAVFIVVMVIALRRLNSSATIFVACEMVTGPMRLMTAPMTNVIPSARMAREKSGRRSPNRHTRPNEPARRSVQPRTRLENAFGGTAGCAVIATASATHAIAMNARPPAHHPTNEHAASAGTNSSIV